MLLITTRALVWARVWVRGADVPQTSENGPAFFNEKLLTSTFLPQATSNSQP